jgi:hypothetical protein
MGRVGQAFAAPVEAVCAAASAASAIAAHAIAATE